MRTLLFILLTAATCCGKPNPDDPVRLGVLLPLSGPSDLNYLRTIEWVVDQVNLAGGIAGRPLELRTIDLATIDVVSGAKDLIADPTVKAVIGPDTSGRVFAVAPLFISAQKPMVSPTSTAGDIFRAFAGKKYIWRTVESDIAQLRILLQIAENQGAQRIGLLAPLTEYGNTFFDWFGFLGAERGLEITDMIRYDFKNPCETATRAALLKEPDVLIAVATNPEDVVCIVREATALGQTQRLLLTDVADAPYIPKMLGNMAEGLTGTSITWAQSTGFEIAHRQRFGEEPTNYAANTYDAVALLAYGLSRSQGEGGEALALAITEIVDVRSGMQTAWHNDGMRMALAMLEQGELPRIAGATGPLKFDVQRHTDLISSTFMQWRIEQGAFVAVQHFDSAVVPGSQADSGSSAFQIRASTTAGQDLTSDRIAERGTRTGLWALIVATSSGWQNYRHQADALAQYQLLRNRGLSDERIILILEDDMALAPENVKPGMVQNTSDGPNLRADAQIDYHPRDLVPQDVMDILAGHASTRLPWVIESQPGDNIYVFIVGHGGRQGAYFNQSTAEDMLHESAVITPALLARTVSDMESRHKYRRMLFAVETCHGGILGAELQSDGVLLLASATPFENSHGANYDPDAGQWLADDFAFHFITLATNQPTIPIAKLYAELYFRVAGSHVYIANQRRFGDTTTMGLAEFVTP